jgi:hypothetical protein
MVVLTTNAPPVPPIRAATRHDTLSTVLAKINSSDAHPDLFEAWEIPSLSFDRLLKRLTDKLKRDTQDAHYGQVILLSGDVHHSFASRILYLAKNRFGDTQAESTKAVVAQLVASSFKKQDPDTVGFQRDGYFYVPKKWVVSTALPWLIHEDMVEGYVGWNVQPGSPPYNVGSSKGTYHSPMVTQSFVTKIRPITTVDPTIQIYPLVKFDFDRFGLTSVVEDEIDLTVVPDYRYRLDYLVPSAQSVSNKTADPIPPMPGGATADQRKAAMQIFNAATDHYREHNKSAGNQKLIGRNNIGEITFDWGERDNQVDHKQVNHTLRWRFKPGIPGDSTPDPDFAGTYVVWTTYTVNLDPNAVSPDPNDKQYPPLAATVEGPRRFPDQRWSPP